MRMISSQIVRQDCAMIESINLLHKFSQRNNSCLLGVIPSVQMLNVTLANYASKSHASCVPSFIAVWICVHAKLMQIVKVNSQVSLFLHFSNSRLLYRFALNIDYFK